MLMTLGVPVAWATLIGALLVWRWRTGNGDTLKRGCATAAGISSVVTGCWIIGVQTVSPAEDRRIDAGLTCRVTDWGFAASDNGYTFHLY